MPYAKAHAAIITAGGQARRYGADKVLASLHGQTLLAHVAAGLQGAAPRLIVSGNPAHHLAGWLTIPDVRPGEGPLAGLESGLISLEGQQQPLWAAFCAADMPHLNAAFWEVLLAQTQSQTHPQAQAVVGLDEYGRPQPLAALYSSDVLPLVSRLLEGQERRMGALLQRLEVITVPYAFTQKVAPRAFHNVNTPHDLA